jgi:hypothetical protein
MAVRHFFQEAPSIGWLEWLKRQLYSPEKIQPNEIQSDFTGNPLPTVQGLSPNPAIPAKTQEYSFFLQTFFYPESINIQLVIPPHFLADKLQSKEIIGIEMRDSSKRLIGCVFDIYAGEFNNTPSGLVTWLCVLPQWRKHGVASAMLLALYTLSLPRKVHWWRNDGWMRSPIPPIWNERRILRKKQIRKTNLEGKRQISLVKVSPSKWHDTCVSQWKTQNPDGMVLLPIKNQPRGLLEVFEAQLTAKYSAAIFVQPTFEIDKITNETYCEIVAWAWNPIPPPLYEQAHFLESMLEQLPYDWIEAPSIMPHLEIAWQNTSQVCWSSICLDPGTPVMRPVLSLCSV